MTPAAAGIGKLAPGTNCTSSASRAPRLRSGCKSATVSASKTRIWALLYKRALPTALVGDSPGCGLRTMEIGSVQGGGLLVQLFCTNGNCMLVAPVREFTRNPLNVPEERLGKLGLAAPAMVG